MSRPKGTIDHPLPADTSVPEPKVVGASVTAGGVVLVLVALCQFLVSNANLLNWMPDSLEPVVLALITAIASYGVGYGVRHQFRTATAARDTYTGRHPNV